MQYMLMFYENEAQIAAERERADHAGPYWDAWNAYMGALYPSGIVVRGDALLPPAAATTVRLEGGKRLVQDGPVAATKEQLGGYVVIEVPVANVRLKTLDLRNALKFLAIARGRQPCTALEDHPLASTVLDRLMKPGHPTSLRT